MSSVFKIGSISSSSRSPDRGRGSSSRSPARGRASLERNAASPHGRIKPSSDGIKMSKVLPVPKTLDYTVAVNFNERFIDKPGLRDVYDAFREYEELSNEHVRISIDQGNTVASKMGITELIDRRQLCVDVGGVGVNPGYSKNSFSTADINIIFYNATAYQRRNNVVIVISGFANIKYDEEGGFFYIDVVCGSANVSGVVKYILAILKHIMTTMKMHRPRIRGLCGSNLITLSAVPEKVEFYKNYGFQIDGRSEDHGGLTPMTVEYTNPTLINDIDPSLVTLLGRGLQAPPSAPPAPSEPIPMPALPIALFESEDRSHKRKQTPGPFTIGLSNYSESISGRQISISVRSSNSSDGPFTLQRDAEPSAVGVEGPFRIGSSGLSKSVSVKSRAEAERRAAEEAEAIEAIRIAEEAEAIKRRAERKVANEGPFTIRRKSGGKIHLKNRKKQSIKNRK